MLARWLSPSLQRWLDSRRMSRRRVLASHTRATGRTILWSDAGPTPIRLVRARSGSFATPRRTAGLGRWVPSVARRVSAPRRIPRFLGRFVGAPGSAHISAGAMCRPAGATCRPAGAMCRPAGRRNGHLHRVSRRRCQPGRCAALPGDETGPCPGISAQISTRAIYRPARRRNGCGPAARRARILVNAASVTLAEAAVDAERPAERRPEPPLAALPSCPLISETGRSRTGQPRHDGPTWNGRNPGRSLRSPT